MNKQQDQKMDLINPMFEQIIGRSKSELGDIEWSKFTHPDDLAKDLDKYEKFLNGEIDKYEIEKRYIRPDGSYSWVHLIITSLNLNNLSDKHLCLIRDITEQKLAEKALKESERSKSVLLSHLPGMAYRCNFDRNWTMEFASEGCYSLTGYKPSELVGNKKLGFNDIIDSKYRESIWEKWNKNLYDDKIFEYEYEIITKNGERKWVLEMGQGVYDRNHKVIALEGIIIDISDRKENEIRLKYLSEHDVTTGLYNRRYFEEVLLQDKGEKRAVVLLNLNRISPINLAYGYRFTEELIKEVAKNLSVLTGENRELFQISFARFAYYITDYESVEDLTDFCEEIFNVMKTMQILHTMRCDVGILEISRQDCDAEKILRNASIAAEYVDKNQMFGYSLFEDKLKFKMLRDGEIKDELVKVAFDRESDNLFLELQPILNLRTNKIRGFESLARLKSDKLGIVSPREFIPIAEETRLIILIGQKIMYMAAEFLRELEEKGHDDIKVTFNVSALQLNTDEFLDELTKVIRETGINPKNFGLEITESIFADDFDSINAKLGKVKDMGLEIAVDDFGTGYSSLARERELNINGIKIDKYFTDKLLSIEPEESITGDIISMAHKIGHYVIAEGVETHKQKEYLINYNCDMMQGYLFSKPVDQQTAITLLE
jgi:PAS domain S-box-containing protein